MNIVKRLESEVSSSEIFAALFELELTETVAGEESFAELLAVGKLCGEHNVGWREG